MAVDFTGLTAAVTNEKTVDDSVVALLTVLSNQIATLSATSTDPQTQAQLDALVATMTSQASAVAAAVTANTPVAATGPTGATGASGASGASGPVAAVKK